MLSYLYILFIYAYINKIYKYDNSKTKLHDTNKK